MTSTTSTTPKEITYNIREFCKEIDSSKDPHFVTVQPEPWCDVNECFNNVENHIQSHGGSIQYGWIIWEIPNIFLDAEFHAVWVNPSGDYIDITPKLDNERIILFLPDSQRVYENKLIENIRKPLIDNEFTRRLIKEEQMRFQLRRKHFKNGKVDVDALLEELEVINSKKVGRNEPCLCGSGKKYKKCCGEWIMWWIILGVLAVVAIAVVWFLSRVRSLPVFYATYDYMLKENGSKQAALRAAISVFVKRPPFNILMDDDIEALIRVFAPLPYPQVLGRIFLEVDKSGDASVLKDQTRMRKIAEELTRLAISQNWFGQTG